MTIRAQAMKFAMGTSGYVGSIASTEAKGDPPLNQSWEKWGECNEGRWYAAQYDIYSPRNVQHLARIYSRDIRKNEYILEKQLDLQF